MGDPECQTILPKLNSDFLDIVLSCCNGELDKIDIQWKKDKSLCIVLCSKGYPADFEKQILIEDLRKIKLGDDEYCYHAGTTKIENEVYAMGGRVLNFVAISDDFKKSRKKVIDLIKSLNWNGGFYRKDIGYKVIDE